MSGDSVWFTSASTALFARRFGEQGTPVVLLHGSGLDDNAAFGQLAEGLAETHQVLTVDVRGYGRSICPDPALHRWDQYAADVVALLDDQGLDTAVVGGYSLGAGIALATAVRHPVRVSGLILGWPSYAGSETGLTARQERAWELGRQRVAAIRRDGLRSHIYAEASAEDLDPIVISRLDVQDEASLLAALEGELQTAQPFRSLKQLTDVPVPTLLFPGCDDAHDPVIAAMYGEHLPASVIDTADAQSPLGDGAAVKHFLSSLPWR